MKTVKTFSLTSENLRKFEKELQEKDRKRHSLQRNIIPERTEADGRSSGIHSYGSQLSAFKETLNENSKHVDTKRMLNSNNNSQGPRKHSYSLDRPEREAFRRNPEGQSRNESSHATPHIVKIDYEEGSDRIKYSDSEKGINELVSDKDEEEESDDDDDDSSDDDDDDDDDEDDESDEESDESDEQSDDDETETTPKRPFETPTTVRTHYTSSINASVSSIPTVASVKTRPESTNTTKTTKTARKGSAFSNASSAPSYILNTNQYRMKQMVTKKEKEREKLGAELTESELSIAPSRQSNASELSMREKATTSVQSNGSYVATRNWSRWSNYSAAGYSISEGPETSHKFRKQAKKGSTPQKMHAKTSRHRPQSRSRVPHLPVIGKNISSTSVPDLRKAGKRHVTLTLDPGLLRARPMSRSQIASRLSTRSIIKRPTTTRVKSVPNLNKQAVMSYFEMERGMQKSVSKSGLRKKSVKTAEVIDYREAIKQKETDDGIDFKNRRKRVRKLKERPQRQRNETSLSSASSVHSNLRQRNKIINKRGSSLSSAMSMSSLKSSQTEQSRKPASSSASSKASLASRKARLPPLKKYAGYHSGRDHMSSGASLLAPGTPVSVILQRSPSLRSVVTEYSSYLSLAASSVTESARHTSRSSLSSTGKYLVISNSTECSANNARKKLKHFMIFALHETA